MAEGCPQAYESRTSAAGPLSVGKPSSLKFILSPGIPSGRMGQPAAS